MSAEEPGVSLIWLGHGPGIHARVSAKRMSAEERPSRVSAKRMSAEERPSCEREARERRTLILIQRSYGR